MYDARALPSWARTYPYRAIYVIPLSSHPPSCTLPFVSFRRTSPRRGIELSGGIELGGGIELDGDIELDGGVELGGGNCNCQTPEAGTSLWLHSRTNEHTAH